MAANRISLKTGKEVVHSVEFSPYQQSCSLLAVGGRSQVSIKACELKVNWVIPSLLSMLSCIDCYSLFGKLA